MRAAAGILAAVLFCFGPRAAYATCDVIPGPTAQFRGALGSSNRPFAIPGDAGQQIEITLDPAGCDSASPGFLNIGGGLGEDDYFITILFEPPDPGAARNAVVLTTSANVVACNAALAAAVPLLGAGGGASCRTVQPGTQELSIHSASTLSFRFPDTDAELAPDDDDHTFTGPATLAVSPVSAALPFGLASARCADTAGLVACIDELHPADGTCDDEAAHVDPVFGHFTALPPANDYRALCDTPNTECTGATSELRFTIDRAGNALVPVDWRGVLLRPDGIPVPRLLRGETDFPALSSAPLDPVRVPGRSFLASYAPSGRRVPPIFEPLTDPSSPTHLVLFGSVDAPVGVMRIARRLANDFDVHRACDGGANEDLPCVAAEDCPSATCGATTCYESNGTATVTPCTRDAQCVGAGQVCGPSLFDFSDRLAAGGRGPVLIPSSQYALNAENPVPLEGLLETPSMFAFVELEAIAGDTDGLGGPEPRDLNGDGDITDAVLVLRDRRTGTITPIGSTTGEGRAATRIHDAPFSSPALSVDGDVAAFLESEPLENAEDANGDGDVFDSILRVYRMTTCIGAPCAQSIPTGDLAVDADPIVEGQSVVLANGRVYFRAAEAQNARQITERITTTPARPPDELGSYYGTLSRNGRYLNFTSDARMIPNTGGCGDDTNPRADVYSLDRDSNGDGVFDDPAPYPTRLSVRTDGCQGESGPFVANDLRSWGGPVTPDGRFVGFTSAAHLDLSVDAVDRDAIAPPGGPYVPQVDAYLRDRDTDGDGIFDEPGGVSTRVIGVSSSGIEANNLTGPVAMTPDGRFVVLNSIAWNLAPGDSNGQEDVFVRDRDVDADGVLDEPSGVSTSRLSLGVGGGGTSCNELSGSDGAAGSGGSITDDGRFVAFTTRAHAVPEDVDNETDVFLRDRDVDQDGIFDECGEANSTTTLVNVGPPNQSPNLKDTSTADLATDGSLISFKSESTNLVAGDTNGVQDSFVKDLRTGVVTRVTVDSTGVQQNQASGDEYLDRRGRYVVFPSQATNLDSLGENPSDSDVDLFLHDLRTGHTERVTVDNVGNEANGDSLPGGPFDGRFLSFQSRATNLGGPDENGSQFDIFVRGADTTDLAVDFSGDGLIDDTVLYVLDTTAPVPAPVVLGPARAVSVASDGTAAFLRPEEQSTGFTCNADGDFADACVFLSVNGASATNLGREATEIGVSPDLVAALVPGIGGAFVQVYGRPAGPWSANLGPPADSLEVSGTTVSFRAAGTGILYVYDHDTATVTDVGQRAEDFVSGDEIVAFRTRETTTDLNGDGDTKDDVLRVWDRVTQQLLETSHAVTPCRFEACRPGRPYRVSKSSVTFLTLEADQGNSDLDGNGDANGIVIQTFNARKAASQAGGGGSFARAAFSPLSGGGGDDVITLAGVSAGVCTTTGEACSTDADCGGGADSCFLPPGGCIQDLQTPCNVSTGCGAEEFCVPTPGAGGAGTCHLDRGACSTDADCFALPNSANTVCEDGDRDRLRLVAPLAEGSDAGDQLLQSRETGEGTCSSDAQCEPDEFCAATLRCQPDQPEVVTAGAPDTDRDGVDDVNDDCIRRSNPDQVDVDGDGVGDACDLQICGDGIQTYAEECDGGNDVPGDGCDETCRLEPGALPACQNGVDDDGDGKIDLADGGCANASDASERRSDRACDDGIDNDGDGGIDFAGPSLPDARDDLGCASEAGTIEDPKCQNGLNDDGALGIDFDGGASLDLTGSADPQCAGQPWKNKEAAAGCGAGAETAIVLAALALARRRGTGGRVGSRRRGGSH